MNLERRSVLVAPLAVALLPPAAATPASLAAAMAAFTGGRAVSSSNDGRVALDIAPLVENGNAVPVAVRVASPMTEAAHVQRVALFAELNPEPLVLVFHLGPANGAREGRVTVATRMRLATSQTVVALAQFSDGRLAEHRAQVLVTLAACVEGG